MYNEYICQRLDKLVQETELQQKKNKNLKLTIRQ